MKRYRVVVAAMLLAVAAQAEDRPPNIVFILADDVGTEPIGCYGGTSWATPNIDRLAQEGMKFRHCYSMPVCHPSRTTLLLGRYPLHTGNSKWGSFPKPMEGETVAHVLRNAGYETVVAGKWQLALLGKDRQHPHRLGFDEFCLFGWHEGPRYHNPMIWQNGVERESPPGAYGPDLYVDFLVDFFEKNREKPFFAFYSMALCHDVTDDLASPVPYVPGRDRYLNYGEMIGSMDYCVGRVVAALDRLRLRENTLIVFTGDNGTAKRSIIRAEQPNATSSKWKYVRDPVAAKVNGVLVPGGKGNLTNDGTHVPLICNWPGRIPASSSVDDLVDFSDFLPTFAELGGADAPPGVKLDGRSFAARARGDGAGTRTWAFSQSGGRHWVRSHQWKLYNDGRLFDLFVDPGEQRNLAGAVRPDAQADVEKLANALKQLVTTPRSDSGA